MAGKNAEHDVMANIVGIFQNQSSCHLPMTTLRQSFQKSLDAPLDARLQVHGAHQNDAYNTTSSNI